MEYIEFECISLGFENCEGMIIPKNDIASMSLNNIVENYLVFYNGEKTLHKYKKVKDVVLKLKPQANKEYIPYGFIEEKTSVFRRLEIGDITSIDLIGKDNDNKVLDSFSVDFDGEEINSNQTTRIDEYGDFEIAISPDNCRS